MTKYRVKSLKNENGNSIGFWENLVFDLEPVEQVVDKQPDPVAGSSLKNIVEGTPANFWGFVNRSGGGFFKPTHREGKNTFYAVLPNGDILYGHFSGYQVSLGIKYGDKSNLDKQQPKSDSQANYVQEEVKKTDKQIYQEAWKKYRKEKQGLDSSNSSRSCFEDSYSKDIPCVPCLEFARNNTQFFLVDYNFKSGKYSYRLKEMYK